MRPKHDQYLVIVGIGVIVIRHFLPVPCGLPALVRRNRGQWLTGLTGMPSVRICWGLRIGGRRRLDTLLRARRGRLKRLLGRRDKRSLLHRGLLCCGLLVWRDNRDDRHLRHRGLLRENRRGRLRCKGLRRGSLRCLCHRHLRRECLGRWLIRSGLLHYRCLRCGGGQYRWLRHGRR